MLFSTKNSLGGGRIVNRLVKKATSTLIVTSLIVGSCPLALADYQDGESRVYYESSIKAPSIGNYEFEVETHEVPSHEWLPIVSKDYFPSTTAQFITEVDNLPPSATYEAKALTKVDVVFAFGEMSQSQQMQDYMDSFEQRLGSAGNNIDAYVEKVETSTIDSNDAGAAEIFNNWTNYPDSSGNWTFNQSDNSMGSTQNVAWTGFWNEESQDTTDVTIEYKSKEVIRVADQAPINYPSIQCHPDPMGWTFRMTYDNGLYSYYAFMIYAYQGIAILARVENTPNPNDATSGLVTGWTSTIPNSVGITNGHVTQLAYVSVDYNPIIEHSVKIDCKGTNITIVYDGNVIIDYNDSSQSALTRGSYGPFTFSMPNGNFYDIKITTGASKSLGEAISDVAWRDNSVRFVVYGEDTIPEYMQNTTNADYQYTITKLLNSNAYLIPLGTSTNKSVMEQLIKFISSPTETKGKFINNVPIITAMNSACDWIISLVRNNSKPTQWILVNTPIVWNTIYKDSEHDLPLNFGEHDGRGESLSDKSDTFDLTLASSWGVGLSHYFSNQDKILAEKWRYIHHYTFYDNSTREETFSNVWISDPIEIFPEPGLYRINYKRKDNPLYTDVNLSNPFDEYRYWSTDYDPIIE